MNTSNVVFEDQGHAGMAEDFEEEDSDFAASHLGTGDRGPKTDRSRPRSVPVNAHVVIDDANPRMVGKPEVIQRRGGAKPIWTLARLCGSSKNTSAGTSR